MSTQPVSPSSHEQSWPNPQYAWFVIIVLFICSIFSFLDRQILSLLVEEIKADLDLSEIQMGLLLGLPFALFYAGMSIPIALAADKLNRKNIIAAGVAFWSLATAACGLAGSFLTLFMARIGVGAGEAALSPSAVSIISDYFPKEKLAMPMAVFTMGNLTGVGVAMILGGPIALYVSQFDAITLPVFGEIFPWQLTFFFVGLPGLALAMLVLSLREPKRKGLSNLDAQSEPAMESLARFARFFMQHWKAFSTLVASFTLLVLMAYANFAWMPTFFRRSFGWDVAEAGVNYGMIVLIAGTTGAFFGGWFSNFLAGRGYRDAPFRATMLCTIPLAPAAFGTFMLADSGMEAVLWFIPWQFFGSVPAGLAGTAMMTITPNEMRAKISSFYLFFSNLIGVTIGAALVAWFTQEYFADEARINESLAIVNCVFAPIAVLIIWRGMKHFRQSRDEVEAATTT